LRKLPKWEAKQDLYRGVNLDVTKKYPDKYQLQSKITWSSLVSTTTQIHVVTSFFPPNSECTIFTINGVFSGRSVQQASSQPNETEILLPPGSRFEVVSIAKIGLAVMVQLKQIPSLEKMLQME